LVQLQGPGKSLRVPARNKLMDDLLLMPDEHRQSAQRMETEAGAAGRARAVADYVAGMTDRYAISEHERLFVPAQRS
jgi:dGTPase